MLNTQMTEQYSAYQTLAAQAAITQQLRAASAASDSSQVGGKWGDHHGKWGRGCFLSNYFRFAQSKKMCCDNNMSLAGAGNPGCAGPVCPAGSAGKSGSGKFCHKNQLQ